MDHLFCLGGKLPSISTLAEGGRNGCKGWCSIFGVFIQLIKFCNKVRKKSFRSGVLCRERIMDSIFIYIRFKFINNDLLQIHTEFISQTRKGSVFLSDKLSPHQPPPLGSFGTQLIICVIAFYPFCSTTYISAKYQSTPGVASSRSLKI